MIRTSRIAALVLGAVLLAASPLARAGAINFNDFQLIVAVDGVQILTLSGDQAGFNPTPSDPDYAGEFSGSIADIGGWQVDWSFLVDPDPVVLANLSVVNNLPTASMFSVTAVLPTTPPIVGGSLLSGSVVGGAIDGNGDGVTVGAPPGGSMYQAFVDFPGVPVQALLTDPATFVGGPGGGVGIPFSSFGLPTAVAGPDILTNIALRLTVTLTPGDSAVLTGNFTAVPEPSSLLLVVCGVLSVALSSRRR